MELGSLCRRRVAGRFDAGGLGSDRGKLPGELALRSGLFRPQGACFRHYR